MVACESEQREAAACLGDLAKTTSSGGDDGGGVALAGEEMALSRNPRVFIFCSQRRIPPSVSIRNETTMKEFKRFR